MMYLSREAGIYQILNLINNKFYIGSAADFYERYHSHLHCLNKSDHHNEHLQRAWNKYGPEVFEFQIIEITRNLIEREQYWIDSLKACELGYNIRKIANSNLGMKFSDEHRAKMSAWQIGNKLSEETKKKISDTLTGRIIADDVRLRMGVGHRKLDKWPCIDGWKCKCEECLKKKNKAHVIYKMNAKVKRKLNK